MDCMVGKKWVVLVVLVVAIAAAKGSMAQLPDIQCYGNLMSCVAVPLEECCKGLHEAVDKQVRCLCDFLFNPIDNDTANADTLLPYFTSCKINDVAKLCKGGNGNSAPTSKVKNAAQKATLIAAQKATLIAAFTFFSFLLF